MKIITAYYRGRRVDGAFLGNRRILMNDGGVIVDVCTAGLITILSHGNLCVTAAQIANNEARLMVTVDTSESVNVRSTLVVNIGALHASGLSVDDLVGAGVVSVVPDGHVVLSALSCSDSVYGTPVIIVVDRCTTTEPVATEESICGARVTVLPTFIQTACQIDALSESYAAMTIPVAAVADSGFTNLLVDNTIFANHIQPAPMQVSGSEEIIVAASVYAESVSHRWIYPTYDSTTGMLTIYQARATLSGGYLNIS